MISLKSFREYWEAMVDSVDGLKKSVALSVESNMADKIAKIAKDDSPTLFFLAPSAEGSGSPDAFQEDNMCVIFIMQKYEPKHMSSEEVLEMVQPVMEAVKSRLLADCRCPCHFMRISDSKISVLPETDLFGNWAGWSIGFTVISQ